MHIGVIAQRLGLPVLEAIDMAARLGVDGVQLYSVSRTENMLEYDGAARRAVMRRAADAGVEIAAVCGEVGGFGFRLADKNPERIALSRRNIDLALDLGCRIVSSHIGVVRADPADDLYCRQRDALREVGAYAAAHDAFFAVETGPEPAEVLKRLLDEVASPAVAVNFDPANFVMVLNADPVAAVGILAPYIVHTHAKDGVHFQACDPERVYEAFARGGIRQLMAETGNLFAECPLGSGNIDWVEYIRSLRDISYTGYLTIEQEVTSRSPEQTGDAVKFLRKVLNDA